MPSSERVNWQPISQMPLVASMIDGALSDTADHLQTLTKARAQPHVLDDATIDRVERVHREQLQFVDIYAEQLRCWQDQGPSAAERKELDRLEEKNRNLRQVTTEVLTLATELRKGTIDRIIAMSDLERSYASRQQPPAKMTGLCGSQRPASLSHNHRPVPIIADAHSGRSQVKISLSQVLRGVSRAPSLGASAPMNHVIAGSPLHIATC